MRRIFILSFLMSLTTIIMAQRNTDLLNRGLVAVPGQSGGNLVSWRLMGEEYYDVTYNLYSGGTLIASGLKTSNFVHSAGSASSTYQVAAVINGVEQPKSASVGRWNDGYLRVPVAKVKDREGKDATADYSINDISLGDVNGDGVAEFIMKRNAANVTSMANKTRFHRHEVYDIKGKLLWSIDLGPNMMAEADEQWDAIAFDWDGDGKAEVLLRGADNMIIHTASGKDINIGDMTLDTRYEGIPYTGSGNEYLLYLNGETGEPYQIGPSTHPDYLDYPLPRGNDSDWGSGIYGHRSTKHFFGAPFLDGRKASIFLGRGAYTKHHMKALDVDPQTHQLSVRWEWKSDGLPGSWFGQGFHNFAIADVDEDGRDEIVFGSMVIDDNGKGLSTTGLGHGDAQHCGDFDPYRKGLEQFTCNEASPNNCYRNATTSKIYYRSVGGSDDGRGLMGNFTNSYPGCQGRSVNTALISSVADKEITELDANGFIEWAHLSFRIYWDGDLEDEVLDSPGTEREAVVFKPNGGRIFQSVGCKMNNWSKNNPCSTGDIIGDWREEIIIREGDNSAIRIYTTPYYTQYRIPTLWHDHVYRNGMVWECMGYNQPPHVSYFVGEMEGITMAPPPLTMTGRTEILDGGAITTSHNGQHVIVCEMNDTKVNISEGASPAVATFNVPSHVEGNNSNTSIKTSFSTCEVSGGAFGGQTRLVKQGDGLLILPDVQFSHSGSTDIWAGTLQFSGSMHNSALWLNRHTTLISDGGQFRSIKADYGSTIIPGGSDHEGTISVDSALTLGFGSAIALDLYSEGLKADQINASTLIIEKKTSDVWQKYGPKYLQPVIQIVEHMNEGESTLTAGDYVIGKVGQINGSLANIKIEGVTNLKTGLSVDEEGNLILSLGSVRGASEMVWSGATSNIWDYAKTSNFYQQGDTTKTLDVFVKNDIVNFNDLAVKTAVKLEDEIEADTVKFINSSKSFTLSGTGSITGSTTLLKEGKGSVTISTDNTYTGGNKLKGGVVVVSSLSNANKAAGNLGAVTTSAARFTMENGAELRSTANVTNGSPIMMLGTDGGIINNSDEFSQTAAFSGTTLTKKGTGWLKPTVAGSLSKLIVAAGTVDAGQAQAKQIELQGTSALTGTGFLSTPIFVAEKAAARLTTVDGKTTAVTLTGKGKLTVYCNAQKGSGWYATRTPLQFNLSKFEGTLGAEAVYADDGRFALDTSTGGAGWALNIPASRFVTNSGRTLRMGRLLGSGNLGGYSSFRQNQTPVANTWQVGNDTTDFTFEGKVTSIDAFEKVGKCKMTAKGKWDQSGKVTVTAGKLALDGATLGTGDLSVARGATLSGVGTLTNSLTTINGLIQPGKTETATSGTIDMGGKNLTISLSGTYLAIARRGYTKTNSGCLNITNINKMTINGTIQLKFNPVNSIGVGDSIQVFSAKSFSGRPKFILPRQFVWDTSRISTGWLFITGIAVLEDVNGDGVVDTQDVLRVYEYMQNDTNSSEDKSQMPEDVNMDGVVDTQDILMIYEKMQNS